MKRKRGNKKKQLWYRHFAAAFQALQCIRVVLPPRQSVNAYTSEFKAAQHENPSIPFQAMGIHDKQNSSTSQATHSTPLRVACCWVWPAPVWSVTMCSRKKHGAENKRTGRRASLNACNSICFRSSRDSNSTALRSFATLKVITRNKWIPWKNSFGRMHVLGSAIDSHTRNQVLRLRIGGVGMPDRLIKIDE